MLPQKKLIQEIPGWFKLYDDGSVDRTYSGPPQFKYLSEPVPPHSEFIDGVATQDVVIDEISGRRVRLYRPETNPGDKLPILLHFHGGGFCLTQPDWFMYNYFYSRLSRTARVICVSVYLRLAPENRLPAAIDDAFSALLWLQSVANRQSDPPEFLAGADFRQVFLIGDSSGGNLVHHVAAIAMKRDLSLAGGIVIHPGFVRSRRSKSERENPETPMLTVEMMDKCLAMGLPVGSDKDHRYTCPMGSPSPELVGLKLPAMLVCLAEKDLMVETQREYYEAMKKAKKEVDLFVSEGMGHCFYLNSGDVEMDAFTAQQTLSLAQKIKHFICSSHSLDN